MSATNIGPTEPVALFAWQRERTVDDTRLMRISHHAAIVGVVGAGAGAHAAAFIGSAELLDVSGPLILALAGITLTSFCILRRVDEHSPFAMKLVVASLGAGTALTGALLMPLVSYLARRAIEAALYPPSPLLGALLVCSPLFFIAMSAFCRRVFGEVTPSRWRFAMFFLALPLLATTTVWAVR